MQEDALNTDTLKYQLKWRLLFKAIGLEFNQQPLLKELIDSLEAA